MAVLLAVPPLVYPVEHVLIAHLFVTVFALHVGVVHVLAPVAFVHVAAHDDWPVAVVVFPPVHAVHPVAPAELYEPIAQAVQLLAAVPPVALRYVPAEQFVPALAPAGQYLPAGHIVRPHSLLCVPVLHCGTEPPGQ